MNNVVATGPNSFYFTNFLASRVTSEQVREIEEKMKTGSIGYYDGQKARIVARDLIAANGINISPDDRSEHSFKSCFLLVFRL